MDILRGILGSGYGHSGSYSSGHGDCCPLVVDPLAFSALLGFLAAAVYFFQVLIEMSMLMMRRKRRRKRELNFQTFLAVDTLDNWVEGKLILEKINFLRVNCLVRISCTSSIFL